VSDGVGSPDPTVVHSVAVTVDDAVTALEANERRDAGAVLRLTPPFAPRMRARLHRTDGTEDYGDPAPVHVDPAAFCPSVPTFPSPDDTAAALRDDPEREYTVEAHREAHAAAVASWRETVRGRLADEVALPLADGDHAVTVKPLG
jgi:hypothetical protein